MKSKKIKKKLHKLYATTRLVSHNLLSIVAIGGGDAAIAVIDGKGNKHKINCIAYLANDNGVAIYVD